MPPAVPIYSETSSQSGVSCLGEMLQLPDENLQAVEKYTSAVKDLNREVSYRPKA